MTPGSTSALYTIKKAQSGFAIYRDGKALETPAGAAILVPTRSLAEAIAGEKPQHRSVNPKSMPLLQLAATAIDIVEAARDETIRRILAYGSSELLCHRTEHPPALMKEQEKIWQPLLDWCAQSLKVPLRTGTGIMPIAQSPESIVALQKIVEDFDAFGLVGLSAAVAASGSLVLGLALMRQRLTADGACRAAELDAEHQMKDWGDDPDVRARIGAVRDELALCERWFRLLHK